MSTKSRTVRHHDEDDADLESHENHERWLLTYSDMITLLMVLFIIMYAISQIDQRKYMALKTGLQAGFGAPVAMLSGADQMLDPGGAVAPDSVNLTGDVSSELVAPALQPEPRSDPEKQADLRRVLTDAEVVKEFRKLEKARKDMVAALRKAGIPKAATFRYDERGLVVAVATDDVLFANASAELRPAGRTILHTLAPTLREVPNKLSIDGHTNSIPISTERYPSNWELSADRATGVLRHLAATERIPARRLSASAFAATKPRRPDSDPRSVVLNRRVEIVLIAPLDQESGRALNRLGEDVTAQEESTGPAEADPATTRPQTTATAYANGTAPGGG